MRNKERNDQVVAQRMDQIRSAAAKVFARSGYAAATTDEIAREAGVSPGLVFHYFDSKKNLLVEVVASLVVESFTRFLQPTDGEEAVDLLVRFAQGHGQFISQNLDLIKVVLYEAQFHEEVRDLVVSKVLLPATAALEDNLRRLVSIGVVRSDLDFPLAARLLIGAVTGLTLMKEVLRDPVLQSRDPAETSQQLLAIFLDGVRAPLIK